MHLMEAHSGALWSIQVRSGPFLLLYAPHEFGKSVIFSKQYKILEIRKCYSMALVFTFDIPQIMSPGT